MRWVNSTFGNTMTHDSTYFEVPYMCHRCLWLIFNEDFINNTSLPSELRVQICHWLSVMILQPNWCFKIWPLSLYFIDIKIISCVFSMNCYINVCTRPCMIISQRKYRILSPLVWGVLLLFSYVLSPMSSLFMSWICVLL